jgi:hypothetical protein
MRFGIAKCSRLAEKCQRQIAVCAKNLHGSQAIKRKGFLLLTIELVVFGKWY